MSFKPAELFKVLETLTSVFLRGAEDVLNATLTAVKALTKEQIQAGNQLNKNESISDWLTKRGIDSSFNFRKNMYNNFALEKYFGAFSGTAEQNLSLLTCLKTGETLTSGTTINTDPEIPQALLEKYTATAEKNFPAITNKAKEADQKWLVLKTEFDNFFLNINQHLGDEKVKEATKQKLYALRTEVMKLYEALKNAYQQAKDQLKDTYFTTRKEMTNIQKAEAVMQEKNLTWNDVNAVFGVKPKNLGVAPLVWAAYALTSVVLCYIIGDRLEKADIAKAITDNRAKIQMVETDIRNLDARFTDIQKSYETYKDQYALIYTNEIKPLEIKPIETAFQTQEPAYTAQQVQVSPVIEKPVIKFADYTAELRKTAAMPKEQKKQAVLAAFLKYAAAPEWPNFSNADPFLAIEIETDPAKTAESRAETIEMIMEIIKYYVETILPAKRPFTQIDVNARRYAQDNYTSQLKDYPKISAELNPQAKREMEKRTVEAFTAAQQNTAREIQKFDDQRNDRGPLEKLFGENWPSFPNILQWLLIIGVGAGVGIPLVSTALSWIKKKD